jgi:hypothetical protein
MQDAYDRGNGTPHLGREGEKKKQKKRREEEKTKKRIRKLHGHLGTLDLLLCSS